MNFPISNTSSGIMQRYYYNLGIYYNLDIFHVKHIESIIILKILPKKKENGCVHRRSKGRAIHQKKLVDEIQECPSNNGSDCG